jgi:hypothetical protein
MLCLSYVHYVCIVHYDHAGIYRMLEGNGHFHNAMQRTDGNHIIQPVMRRLAEPEVR